MRLALLVTTILLGLGLPASLPSASAATADDTATLFEGPLYSILLPEGWQHTGSKTAGGVLKNDNFKKGSTHLGIVWVPDPDSTSDSSLLSQATAPFVRMLDAPSAAVTQSMKGYWHKRQVPEGIRISSTLNNIPVVISAAVLHADHGRFIILHATNNQTVPGEEETLIRSFTPKP